MNRASLSTLIYKENMIGVEIGVFKGVNALDILENLSISKLYLIDPYNASYPIAAQIFSNDEADNLFMTVQQRLTVFSKKTKFIRKYSIDAINDIQEELDFVYIDGNHSYKNVTQDIETYYPALKLGGLIAGHDFIEGGVKDAVYDSLSKMTIYNDCNDDCHSNKDWWCYKL